MLVFYYYFTYHFAFTECQKMLSTVQEEPIEIDSMEEESSVCHDHSNGPVDSTSLQIICDSANLGMYVY